MNPCEIATERYKNLAKWRNLWTILLFLFGATVVVFSCVVIVLFINASWVAGAITTLGTIVNGVGISWVLARRREAVEEESAAYADLKLVCAGPKPADAARENGAIDDGVPQEVFDYQKKLILFSSIR